MDQIGELEEQGMRMAWLNLKRGGSMWNLKHRASSTRMCPVGIMDRGRYKDSMLTDGLRAKAHFIH